MPPEPFQVSYSGESNDQFRAAVAEATRAGLRAEAIRAARAIEQGLNWLADELGEFRRPLNVLGELRWVAVLPLTAWFVVDRARRAVWVVRFRFVPPRRAG